MATPIFGVEQLFSGNWCANFNEKNMPYCSNRTKCQKSGKDIPNCEAFVLSHYRFAKKYGHVTCYPWKEGLQTFFPELRKFNS